MNKQRKWILVKLMIMSALFTGCSSSRFLIHSDPAGANVYYENPETKERKQLGQTPLELKYSEVNIDSAPYFTLVIEKDKYNEKRILFPDRSPYTKNGEIKVDVSLKKFNSNDGPQNIDSAQWNYAIELLFEAQKLAMEREYDTAITKVKEAIKKTGGFHKAYTLMGSIYMLKKDYKNSLSAWQMAHKLNSHDPNAEHMIQLIQKRMKLGDQ